MDIGLIGYGKMGRNVQRCAIERGHTIVAIVDPTDNEASHRQLDTAVIAAADVWIDFSTTKSVLANIQAVLLGNVPLVVGTTGWEPYLSQVAAWVADSHTALVYGANFSLSAQLYSQLVHYAAQLFSIHEEYDVAGVEIHHRHKKDAPSGTAKELSAHFPHQTQPLFTSLRVGSQPGTHTLYFDSPDDTIELTLRSRNRNAFANGALQAAEWICGKRGFYTFEEVLCIQAS